LLPDVEAAAAEQAGAMTQNTEFPAYVPPPPAPRPPLRRSQSDRVLGGVAAGFARWLGIDPVIVRVVLVVLAVFGGSGLLLYLIGWLFIPEDGAPSSQAERFIDQSRQPNSTARTLLIVVGVVVGVIIFASLVGAMFGGWGGGGSFLLLLAVGALVLYLANRPPTGALPTAGVAPTGTDAAGVPATVSAAVPPAAPAPYAYGGSGEYPGYVAPVPAPVPPTPRPRSYLGLATLSLAVIVTGVLVSLDATGVADVPFVVILASALGILGLGLLVGAFAGRARWLVALAAPLLLVTAPIAMIPADFGQRLDAGIGDRAWVPSTVAQASTPFELSVGSAELDLTRLEIPAGTTTIAVDASVGLGELLVTVPDDVRVLVDAEVGLGTLDVDGLPREDGDDVSVVTELPDGPLTGPTIELTVRTDVGNLEVSRA
jgi:phage shock protein PspC (stress-responsive transcriptional regulator)